MNFKKTIAVSIFLVLSAFTLSSAQSRIALLIGNSDYPNKSLSNPGNDVNLLAKSLTSLGFKVTKEKNRTRSQMLSALRKFYSQIDSDTIALIYFSGHGVHSTVDNLNYLIPIGAFESLINEEDLSNEAISDGKLLASTSGAKFSILLLDACRSNDFAQTRGDKGLGQPSSRLANDYVISYATEVGKTAKDGNGNSPYALALAEYLTKGYSIGDIFTKVRAQVSRSTGGKQKPYYAPHFESILYLSRVGSEVVEEQSNPRIVPSVKPKTEVHNSNNITTIGNLMWQDEPYTKVEKLAYNNNKNDKKVGSWEYAIAYCKHLSLESYDDWRLPTNIELIGLYKQKKKLKNLVPRGHWTSNVYRENSTIALFVSFDDGAYQGRKLKSYSSYVRCVRDDSVLKITHKIKEEKKITKKNSSIKKRILKTTYSQVSLYKNPSLDASVIISLGRNSKVTYINTGDDSNWMKVRTSSGLEGWVEKKRVKEI